jgi:Transposase
MCVKPKHGKNGKAKHAETLKPKPGEKVIPIRCQPKFYPCPTCGKRGHRKDCFDRFVRTIEYGKVAWLHVFYAEYRARCDCRKTFRSCPPNIVPKADYDNLIRQAVLNRILDDGLNVERTRKAMERDFLLNLSADFIYQCLDWGLSQLCPAQQRRFARDHFSGTLCIDELHLGKYTLLLATDPIADRVVGYSLVRVNDQPHMRCFLRTLQYWGFQPKVVVTDGSNLYPTVLAEVWPQARHQLCVFHVLQDVNKKVLAAVRRLRNKQKQRGRCGRKRRRGRGNQGGARQRRRGPTNKEKSAFVYKHRFLIVKRTEKFAGKDWDNLCQMFQYLPDLRLLWNCCCEMYQLFNDDQVVRLARRRRTLLLKKESYQEVPELVEAMGLLKKEKFDKMVAFLESPTGERVRTNNHVERTNRKLRFDEKVRYKWRSRRSLDRFLRLRLGHLALLHCLTQSSDESDLAPESALPGVAHLGRKECRD